MSDTHVGFMTGDLIIGVREGSQIRALAQRGLVRMLREGLLHATSRMTTEWKENINFWGCSKKVYFSENVYFFLDFGGLLKKFTSRNFSINQCYPWRLSLAVTKMYIFQIWIKFVYLFQDFG